jgi:hydroxyacylglutathione hydrolase
MSGLKVAILPVTPFEQNCSLIWCEKTKKAAVVDPGGDVERIKEMITEQGVTLEKILLTHAHVDHAGGVAAIAEAYNVPIEGPHKEDQFLIDEIENVAETYGFPDVQTFQPSIFFEDGDTVTVGELTFEIFHCPGHTPGHVVYYHAPSNLVIVGDVLFQGSIGRTDFPRGNHADLINSIKNKLYPLGDDVTFLPGHGGFSTIGHERATNPFLQ